MGRSTQGGARGTGCPAAATPLPAPLTLTPPPRCQASPAGRPVHRCPNPHRRPLRASQSPPDPALLPPARPLPARQQQAKRPGTAGRETQAGAGCWARWVGAAPVPVPASVSAPGQHQHQHRSLDRFPAPQADQRRRGGMCLEAPAAPLHQPDAAAAAPAGVQSCGGGHHCWLPGTQAQPPQSPAPQQSRCCRHRCCRC